MNPEIMSACFWMPTKLCSYGLGELAIWFFRCQGQASAENEPLVGLPEIGRETVVVEIM